MGAEKLRESLQGTYDRRVILTPLSRVRIPTSYTKEQGEFVIKTVRWMTEMLESKEHCSDKDFEDFLVFISGTSAKPTKGIRFAFDPDATSPYWIASACRGVITLPLKEFSHQNDSFEGFKQVFKTSIHPHNRFFGQV